MYKKAEKLEPLNEGCLMCGYCCGPYFAIYVEEVDEKRWESEGRTDILEYLEWERNRVYHAEDGIYNTETGEPFEKCHYLKEVDGYLVCGIHETKPMICHDYVPATSEICILYEKKKQP